MRTIAEVSSNKLRGGFYTPDNLVSICLDRIKEMRQGECVLDVLEPSIGDGAFFRGLRAHALGKNVRCFTGIEINPEEFGKVALASRSAPFDVRLQLGDVVSWCAETDQEFDVVVGNPPFIRYQFVSDDGIKAIGGLGHRMGIAFKGVSNLWIPVLVGALDRLRPHGAMSIVVPAELFTGVSAGLARQWLLSNFDRLTIDLFPPGSFPEVLQEVVIVSGQREPSARATGSRVVSLVEHLRSGQRRDWNHTAAINPKNWTKFFLSPNQYNLLDSSRSYGSFNEIGDVARLEVSIVTGANEFFSVDASTVERFELHDWLVGLLPRIRYADGLIYTKVDQTGLEQSGGKAWMLDFNRGRKDPLSCPGARDYLQLGVNSGIDQRYKTSIRTPWYRVPSIWPGRMLLSKRSHRFPRLVLNEAGVVTTDTIYRGAMLPIYRDRERDLVSMFHNSLTLLSAELEGRSFGGGVLELVPSEVARVLVPFPLAGSCHLDSLDAVARRIARNDGNTDELIEVTDSLLSVLIPELRPSMIADLAEARLTLMQRRLDRN